VVGAICSLTALQDSLSPSNVVFAPVTSNSITTERKQGVQSSVNVPVSVLAWGNGHGEVLGRVLKGLFLPSGMMDGQEKRARDALGCRELDLGVGVLVVGDAACFYL